MSYHTYSDIGKFTTFPQSYRNRIFPSRAYGRIDLTDVEKTGMLSVMTREQGLKITNDLHRLTLPEEREIDYLKLGSGEIPLRDLKIEVLQDYEGFTAVQQDFSLDLIHVIENFSDVKETNLRVKRFFTPPGIFDGLVTVLALELKKKPMRPHLCERESRRALMKQVIDIIVTTVCDR